MTRQFGPDVIRAADNVPNPAAVLRLVDELPADTAPAVLRRLAAGSEGRLLAQTAQQVGEAALRAEVRHPGVGGALARHLGQDGANLAFRANPAQALHLARHADDIARLPTAQRDGLLTLVRQDFDRFIRWIAEFIEKNPGKVLFTAAATTVIMANSEALLGGTSELVFDADGNPVIIPRTGMIERTLSSVLHRILNWLLPIVAGGLALWIGIRLWRMRKYGATGRSAQPT